jgi:diguanylate cyclase (GGDEF)-like protein
LKYWTRLVVVLAATAAYVAAFLALQDVIGDAAVTLAVVPVGLAVWFYGMGTGLTASLLAIPLNLVLLHIASEPGWSRAQFAASSAVCIAVVPGLNYIRNLQIRWRQDLATRSATRKELERRNRELATLVAVAQSLASSIHLADVLRTALDRTLEIFALTKGRIYLTSEDGKSLELATYAGFSQENAARLKNKTVGDGGYTSQVAGSGTTLVVDDVIEQYVHSRPIMEEEDIRSAIFVPLKSGNRVLGVFTISSSEFKRFSIEDIPLLETIASQIGVAIENARLFERTSQLSLTDELTGLDNRRRFNQVVDAEMDRTRRDGRPFSLVMIDLDEFKKHNDRFGHLSGDALLKSFADTFKSGLRRTDNAFRLGGDEFSIVLPGTHVSTAYQVVDRIRTKWQSLALPEYPETTNPIGFSVGIAEFPDGVTNADELVSAADTRLYESKRAKKQVVSSLDGLLGPEGKAGA